MVRAWREVRDEYALLSSAFILESHWFSAAVLNQGDTRTFRIVTEAIPRRTKSRDEMKICKTKRTQNTDHLVKDWKKAQKSRWLLWLIYIKINASKKIHVSLPSYTTLPVHKDAIWIETGREGESYNYSIYFTGHLYMFYNMVNISKQLINEIWTNRDYLKILPMIWTKNFGICILCILSPVHLQLTVKMLSPECPR